MFAKFAPLVSLLVLCLSAALVTAAPAAGDADATARGKYLVDFGGCHDCHSPKVMTDNGMAPDPKRLLSGHPADAKLPSYDASLTAPGMWALFTQDLTASVGPWGVSYAANITPDDQTGIGLWKFEQFKGAMRTGKHMGAGRPIQLPMPWFNLATLSDDDLAAIFAYLKSLPPVKNAVPANVPPTEMGSSK